MATSDERAQRELADAVRDAKQRAAGGAQELGQEAKHRVEQLSAGIGDRADHLAEAARSAGNALRGKEDWLADAADGLSETLGRFSEAARDKGFDGLRRDVEQFARERPALFMGAAVVAGVALGRLLRSSRPHDREEQWPEGEPPRATSPGTTYAGTTHDGPAYGGTNPAAAGADGPDYTKGGIHGP